MLYSGGFCPNMTRTHASEAEQKKNAMIDFGQEKRQLLGH
jgi:hypothetical protein